MIFKKRKKEIKPPWEEIFASLGDGLVILDQERRLMGINPSAEGITGFSAEVVLGRLLEEAFPENEEVLKRINRSIEETGVVILRDISWRGRHGERLTIDLSLTPLMGDDGELTGWILVFRDLTPLKSLEEEIRKADRLAMMGTVAAGLAHEIKNPLGGIRGAAQLLGRESLSENSSEFLGIIVKEVDRVDRLVNQLLTFSRPKTLEMTAVNLNELLDSLLLLQKEPLIEKGLKVIREFDPSLPPIVGNTEELSQVFLNFIKNAIEAIAREKGEIRVKSRMVSDYRIKGEAGKKPSRMVMTEIRDNGEGISKENLKNIFTPFFTTKEKGYGLGLALSQRIISEHGGLVHVKSEEGKGTSFQIFLRVYA